MDAIRPIGPRKREDVEAMRPVRERPEERRERPDQHGERRGARDEEQPAPEVEPTIPPFDSDDDAPHIDVRV